MAALKVEGGAAEAGGGLVGRVSPVLGRELRSVRRVFAGVTSEGEEAWQERRIEANERRMREEKRTLLGPANYLSARLTARTNGGLQ